MNGGRDRSATTSSSTARLGALFGRAWVFEITFAASVLAAATLILSIVGRRSGWPLEGAFTEEELLVRLYAAHFRHFDFFPVWSSSDALGMGSPVLLFYQKAFFYVAGLLDILLGGALKPALVGTVGIFLVIGAYGMRCALAVVVRSRLLITAGSIGYLFTNYVFTDWLPRGDLPEFSAIMIVPWLLYWCLQLLVRRRVSLLLVPIMVLLVEAHSAIALISLFTLLVVLVTFLVEAGVSGLRAIAPRLALAVGATTLILAPTLLAEVRMARYYDPSSKVTFGAKIAQDYSAFGRYFVDSSYRWLATNSHIFVQIDFAIWIPIVIAVAFMVSSRFAEPLRALVRQIPLVWDRYVLAFLSLTLVLYLFLQLPISLFVYRILSPLEAIDYPFRMLGFITPLGVILVVFLFNPVYCRYRTHVTTRLVPLVWLSSLIVLSPVTSSWEQNFGLLAPPGQFPGTGVSAIPGVIDYRTFGGFFTLTGGILYYEYLPKVFTGNGSELVNDGDLYRQLHRRQQGAASLSRVPCTVKGPTGVPLESLRLTFDVACAGPTRVALPISYNGFTSIFVAEHGRPARKIAYSHLPSDPRIIIDVPSSRPESVVVHLPTLWGILS